MSDKKVFGSFTDQVQNGEASQGDRKSYTLNEDLGIMDMIQNDVPLKTIAEVTGRPIPSLRYRYYDPKRGCLKLILEDETGKKLFESYGEEFKGEADIVARIEAFKASLPDADNSAA